jgi:hypothetical protein
MVNLTVAPKHGSEVATVVNEHAKNGMLAPIATHWGKGGINSCRRVNDARPAAAHRDPPPIKPPVAQGVAHSLVREVAPRILMGVNLVEEPRFNIG